MHIELHILLVFVFVFFLFLFFYVSRMWRCDALRADLPHVHIEHCPFQATHSHFFSFSFSRIDVDTTGGDETYTTLKNSVPFTRVFAKGLKVNGFSQVRAVYRSGY